MNPQVGVPTQADSEAQVAVEQPDHDPLSDPRVRPLIEHYVRLAGGRLVEVEPHLFELDVPPSDRAFFEGRDKVLLAFSVGALERSPNAEMAVIGSAFVHQLLDAIRSRGSRRVLGLIPPTFSTDAHAAPLGVPVANGSAEEPVVKLARHPVGRLLARVVVRAGATVEEYLVEGGVHDLSTGAPASADLAKSYTDVETRAVAPAGKERADGVERLEPRSPEELLNLMTADLQTRLASKIERIQTEAKRALSTELARIDGYYQALLADDAGTGSAVPNPAARRAIKAEHERRRGEEERRHQVRCVVHPLQLIESELLVQRAEWVLSTSRGRKGTVAARRALSGAGQWELSCPVCARQPLAFVVCREDHVACLACARTCSVCSDQFCKEHGLAQCHVDRAPSCNEHARTCSSCHRAYCSAHESLCAEGEHAVCVSCLAPCALCGRAVCASHARQSTPASPRGVRRFCPQCVVYCEGGKNEPVGRDEVVRCASCDRSVCEVHQARCAVDGKVHCSTHLRRTDRSRRLVCEADRAKCRQEAEAIFATDEVRPCTTCGTTVCAVHGNVCVEDGNYHCMQHLAPLKDRIGAFGCTVHRTICHVDSATFSLTGTLACPVCGRATCKGHLHSCSSCARSICVQETDRSSGRCATCMQLTRVAEPGEDLIAAAMDANDGELPKAKEWRASRDATHMVVEVARGWMRRTVFTVRHGDRRAETVVSHSPFGASRRR